MSLFENENNSALTDFTTNAKLSGLRTSLKLTKTMFGEVTEKRVTFCFDISGSMYRVFHHIREHLLETLFKMLLSKRDQKFNIVLFNSSVHQFSTKHLSCDQQNIVNVIKWMNTLYYESMTNMLAGVLQSFEDYPNAVYLVSDGFINKGRAELLRNLPHISKGRPMKCIMITHVIPPDDTALDFMEDMASITNGSLTVISIKDFGAVEVVMPILYSSRPVGGRRSHFEPFSQEIIDIKEIRKNFARCKGCLTMKPTSNVLIGDPLKNLPVIAPFITKDPLTKITCPFYHPYFHWYWPQYWDSYGPSPTLTWTKCDPQYHSMWVNFRDNRSFICGKKYLDTYNEFYNSVSAGMVLINRTVFAFNYREANKLYIGKVISQVTPTSFLIRFNVYNEYQELQQTDINEIIDLEEQKRHSIKVDDFVIAPLDVLKGSYDIAVVLEGQEIKSGNSLVPIKNTKLKVKFLDSNFETYLEFNQAVYVSPKLKEQLEQRKNMSKPNYKLSFDAEDSYGKSDLSSIESTDDYTAGNTNNNALEELNDNYKQDDVEHRINSYCCDVNRYVCNICCHNIRRPSGRVASPVDNGQAKTLEEIDEEIRQNAAKFKENNNVEIKSEEKEEDNFEDEEIEKKDSPMDNIDKYDYNSDEDYDFTTEKVKKDTFTETDLNWCILRLLNKKSKENLNGKEKKMWRYWGRKPIPDVIEPPSTEPYQEPSNWGGCPMPRPVPNCVEWPNVAFQTINPHVITDYSPNKMYEIFHHQIAKPSQRPKRDASVGPNHLSASDQCQWQYEKKFKYLQGAYPKLDIKYPNIDSVKPLLASWSVLHPQVSKHSAVKHLQSIEKDRINAQIQRDEANCLNFLHHKTVSSKKAVHNSGC